jgi:hypothetical protein
VEAQVVEGGLDPLQGRHLHQLPQQLAVLAGGSKDLGGVAGRRRMS